MMFRWSEAEMRAAERTGEVLRVRVGVVVAAGELTDGDDICSASVEVGESDALAWWLLP